jgi:hypothetical protein
VSNRIRYAAWQRWQAAAGPWRGWTQCHPLLAFDGGATASPPPSAPRASTVAIAHELGDALVREAGIAIVLDLDAVLGVEIAAKLNEHHLAHAVLVLPRWPYEHAILPVDALLATLLATSKRVAPAEGASNVVFVLDAERRRGVPRRPALDTRADNRYDLLVSDLPNLSALRAHGVSRILKLSHA